MPPNIDLTMRAEPISLKSDRTRGAHSASALFRIIPLIFKGKIKSGPHLMGCVKKLSSVLRPIEAILFDVKIPSIKKKFTTKGHAYGVCQTRSQCGFGTLSTGKIP